MLCIFLQSLFPSTDALYKTQFITSIKTSTFFSTGLPFSESYKTQKYQPSTLV